MQVKSVLSGKIIFLFFLIFTLFSCDQTKDSDKVADAQQCLDELGNPSAAEVDACVDKVANLSNPQAYGIRCAGKFITNGFSNPQRYIDAFEAIDNSSSAASILKLLGLLTFTEKGTLSADVSVATQTYSLCFLSEGKGVTLLSGYLNIAMGLTEYYNAKANAGCPSTPSLDTSGKYMIYNLGTCVATHPLYAIQLVNNNTVDSEARSAQTNLGTIIAQMYSDSCDSGPIADGDLCSYVKTAVTTAGGTSDVRLLATTFFRDILGIN